MVAGKGVHDVGILSQGLQNVRVHPKDFLRPLIVIDLVAELLPGDLGDIQNIRFRGDLPPIYRAVQGLAARDLVFPQVILHIIFHLQDPGRNEVDFDPRVFGQEIGERPDGAAIQQISYESDGDAVDPPLQLLDAIEINQGLSGMLGRTVPPIRFMATSKERLVRMDLT